MSDNRNARTRPPVVPEFVDLVRAMRKAQRDYFANRTRPFLAVAMAAERKVDDYLRQYETLEKQWLGLSQGITASATQTVYNFGNDGKAEEGKKA